MHGSDLIALRPFAGVLGLKKCVFGKSDFFSASPRIIEVYFMACRLVENIGI
jgi:hypothetical protein